MATIGTALTRYAAAVAVVLAALALKALVPGLGTPAPFLLLSVAAGLAGWVGGRGPGLVAAIVGALGVNVLFIDRSIVDGTATVVLVIAGLADFIFMALAAARLRTALAREAVARESAERAIRARDSFIATVAHELRNPLTTVIASSELLTRRLANDGSLGEQAAVITHEARRANRLIEDLLDASRLDMSDVPIAAGPVDVSAVARAAAASLSARLGGDHRLVVDTPADARTVGDASRLEQVLVNLLDNARKYSPAGGAIELTVRVEGGDVVARVSDRGVGLTPDQAARLFEPLYRARPDEFEGTGLGLYLSKLIVDRHGGDLSYLPRSGGGSTFVLRLPLRRAGHETARTESVRTS